MIRLSYDHSILRRPAWRRALVALIIVSALLYCVDVTNNPKGFFIDESSVAFNAYAISQSGRDEFGIPWPLFFRAFSEHKNPVYVYLLAGIFRLTGPSILVARIFSALLGVLTAFGLGVLSYRVSKRQEIGLIIALMALLTPWLFEMSRVALEVAMYPLAVTCFLLCVYRVSEKKTWSAVDILGLIAALALLAYTYSIGRLLSPLLAAGLALFVTRLRLRSILLTWTGYVLTLIPALLFQRRNPGALTGRFQYITYIAADSTYSQIAWEFTKRCAANLNPWRLFISEHSKVSEIIHIPGSQPILAATALLAIAGLYVVLLRKRHDAWWRFILYGLAVSIVPASLTKESFHMLRLAALPVFLLVLAIPALEWLLSNEGRTRQVALVVLVVLTVLQGAIFQWQYHSSARSPRRLHLFDAQYREKIFEPALLRRERPIYLTDSTGVPGYIQAYWYATLKGFDLSQLTKLPSEVSPPVGAVVISTEESCPMCEVVAAVEPYTLYIAHQPARLRAPLPDDSFRAGIEVLDPPATAPAGQQQNIRVKVRNLSEVTWFARERSGSRFQVSLGNHWLEGNGQMLTNDDGRSPLLEDLKPGEARELSLLVTAPKRSGDYILELDMLQEQVSWFGSKGSSTVRLRLKIE
ncbi:MAG: ArnT family glycosyltransferase [Pyrinomonadaceae bacterium]